MSKDILHMKIDSQVKKDVQEKAKDQNRSISNLVETVLKDFLKKEENQKN